MFDRFYRGVLGAEGPGIGLGLYITRSMIEMLDGTVSARNRSDGQSGLVISILLPLGAVAS
jgi:K+-sensing histidine kinase KdpD